MVTQLEKGRERGRGGGGGGLLFRFSARVQ